jgi:hypothetical protein
VQFDGNRRVRGFRLSSYDARSLGCDGRGYSRNGRPGEHVTALPGSSACSCRRGGLVDYGVVGTVTEPSMIFALYSSIFALYASIFGFDVA